MVDLARLAQPPPPPPLAPPEDLALVFWLLRLTLRSQPDPAGSIWWACRHVVVIVWQERRCWSVEAFCDVCEVTYRAEVRHDGRRIAACLNAVSVRSAVENVRLQLMEAA